MSDGIFSDSKSAASIIGNYNHPLNEVVTEAAIGLQTGEVSMCACVGPKFGEPYCLCEMRVRGLPISDNHYSKEFDINKLNFAIEKIRKERNEPLP